MCVVIFSAAEEYDICNFTNLGYLCLHLNPIHYMLHSSLDLVCFLIVLSEIYSRNAWLMTRTLVKTLML